MRLLVLLFFAVVIWVVIETLFAGWRVRRREAARARRAGQPAAARSANVTLVRCARCGTHIPQSSALPGAGSAVFCSESCRGR